MAIFNSYVKLPEGTNIFPSDAQWHHTWYLSQLSQDGALPGDWGSAGASTHLGRGKPRLLGHHFWQGKRFDFGWFLKSTSIEKRVDFWMVPGEIEWNYGFWYGFWMISWNLPDIYRFRSRCKWWSPFQGCTQTPAAERPSTPQNWGLGSLTWWHHRRFQITTVGFLLWNTM